MSDEVNDVYGSFRRRSVRKKYPLLHFFRTLQSIVVSSMQNNKWRIIRDDNPLDNLDTIPFFQAYFESLRNQWETADTARPIL